MNNQETTVSGFALSNWNGKAVTMTALLSLHALCIVLNASHDKEKMKTKQHKKQEEKQN